jgi:hypothetical protein
MRASSSSAPIGTILQYFRKSLRVSPSYALSHTLSSLALSSPFPFWVVLLRLVFVGSRTGLSASSSSTTYAPVVPSENVTINPSSPSGSVVSIPSSAPQGTSV